MGPKRRIRTTITLAAGASGLLLAAVWLLLAHSVRPVDIPRAGLRPTGEPQLISVEPIPMAEGDTCVWEPASAHTTLTSALSSEPMREGDNTSSASAVPLEKRPIESDRAPARVIHDPNPSFSSLAVDPDTNMLVVTDENLF